RGGRACAGDAALDRDGGRRGRAARAGAPARAHPRLAEVFRAGAGGRGPRRLPGQRRPPGLRTDRVAVPRPRRAAASEERSPPPARGARRSVYDRAVMTSMVQVAVAGDVAEAEEMQEILRNAGIDSSIEQAPEDDAVSVLVPEAELETAQDAIEALTEPDDLISEP